MRRVFWRSGGDWCPVALTMSAGSVLAWPEPPKPDPLVASGDLSAGPSPVPGDRAGHELWDPHNDQPRRYGHRPVGPDPGTLRRRRRHPGRGAEQRERHRHQVDPDRRDVAGPTFGFEGDGLCTMTTPPGNPQPPDAPSGRPATRGRTPRSATSRPTRAPVTWTSRRGSRGGPARTSPLKGAINASDVNIAPIPGLPGGNTDHDLDHHGDHDPSTSTTTPAAAIAASPAFTG